jgi:hypothetical protein
VPSRDSNSGLPFDIVKDDDHDLELHPALLVTTTQATAWRQNNSIFM